MTDDSAEDTMAESTDDDEDKDAESGNDAWEAFQRCTNLKKARKGDRALFIDEDEDEDEHKCEQVRNTIASVRFDPI